MSKKAKAALFAVGLVLVVGLAALYFSRHSLAVLAPKGVVALKERNLIIGTSILSLAVVVPVFVLLFVIVWKYRVTNPKKSAYTPDWDHSRILESIWWGLPCAIILVLAVVAWKSSYDLDPYKTLASSTRPLTIQVVALQWRWLFIYPEQNIATVNFFQFPQNTPLNFQITADAPMNSFWIPQLGGQIYAMAGMTTQLHLMANQTGTFRGVSANISGAGFAGMHFTAKSSSAADFDAWVQSVKRAHHHLSADEYRALARPNLDNRTIYYSSKDPGLYDTVEMKFMTPPPGLTSPSDIDTVPADAHTMNMQGMDMGHGSTY